MSEEGADSPQEPVDRGPDAEVADAAAEAFELGARTDFRGQPDFVVERGRIVEVLTALRDDERFQFKQLIDLTAVDYLKKDDADERFAVVYLLYSRLHNSRLRLRVLVDEDEPRLPSVSGVFGSADWGEREVYDMFGIEFEGHPNLERILMPTNFGGFPLRKDYPLRGRGERDDFPRLRRGGKEDL